MLRENVGYLTQIVNVLKPDLHLLSIVVDFDIPVFFCSDRQVACRFVEGYLLRFHRFLDLSTEPCVFLPKRFPRKREDED